MTNINRSWYNIGMFKKTTILTNYALVLPVIAIVCQYPQWLKLFVNTGLGELLILVSAFILAQIAEVRVVRWLTYYADTPVEEFNANLKRENVSWLQLTRVATSYIWAALSRATLTLAFVSGFLYWIVKHVTTKLVTLPGNHPDVWVLPLLVGIGVLGWAVQFCTDLIKLYDTEAVFDEILENIESTLDKPSDEQE